MKLGLPASKPPTPPIPLSVLLTLLWVGLVHLFLLWVTVQSRLTSEGEAWTALLYGERVLGRARLPTMIIAISFLLLLYLWVDYRSRPAHARRTLVFLVAAALLVYLGWAVWQSWWIRLDALIEPADMLMTARPGALVKHAA